MFKNLKISTKVVVIIAMITLIGVGVTSVATFNLSRDTVEEEVVSRLERIADLKKQRIENFFEDRQKDLMLLNNNFVLRTYFPVVIKFADDRTNFEYIAAVKALNSELYIFQTVKKLDDIMLVNLEGDVVYVANPAHITADIGSSLPDHTGKAFEEGKKGFYMTDLFLNTSQSEEGEIGMLATAPVRDLEGALIGVVAFEFDIDVLFEFIQDATGFGETGETLIGRNEGGYALFLNRLRHDPEAALKRKAPYSNTDALPIREATQGISGSGITIDYRPEPIIAAWRPLDLPSPHLQWGLVAKMDTKEAFASAVDLRNQTLLIGAAMLLIVSSLAYYLSRSISDPIIALRDAALEIKQGDLTKRAQVKSNDEVGQLAEAFNAMTDKLEESYRGLEEKVATRTKELTASNKRLQMIVQKLTVVQADLGKAVAEKGEFLTIAAHELRTPLQPIIGYASRLLHKGNLTDWQKEKILVVLKSADRLAKLVQDILDINKMETGVIKFSQQEVNLLSLLKDVHKLFRLSAEKKHLQLILDVPDALSSVVGDSRRLMQVFSNLIDNALKFTEQGSITIKAEERKGKVSVTISDTGIGIAQEHIPEMFTKFFQIESFLKRTHEGTGLGLAIAKAIVEAHKGEILVESMVEKGSIFQVTLPVLAR